MRRFQVKSMSISSSLKSITNHKIYKIVKCVHEKNDRFVFRLENTINSFTISIMLIREKDGKPVTSVLYCRRAVRIEETLTSLHSNPSANDVLQSTLVLLRDQFIVVMGTYNDTFISSCVKIRKRYSEKM